MTINVKKLNKFGEYIKSNIPDQIKVTTEIVTDGLVLNVQPDDLIRVLFFLRDNTSCTFKQLVDVFGVDYPEREKRFEVVYNLLSLNHNQRIRVKTNVSEGEEIPSATVVFKSAGWLEREVFDMYGVRFIYHPDLRRILTDYGFEGHPQRKDFPLTGYKEVRYDEKKKQVIYEDVKLDQEFRNFDFASPWDGTEYVNSVDDNKKASAEE